MISRNITYIWSTLLVVIGLPFAYFYHLNHYQTESFSILLQAAALMPLAFNAPYALNAFKGIEKANAHPALFRFVLLFSVLFSALGFISGFNLFSGILFLIVTPLCLFLEYTLSRNYFWTFLKAISLSLFAVFVVQYTEINIASDLPNYVLCLSIYISMLWVVYNVKSTERNLNTPTALKFMLVCVSILLFAAAYLGIKYQLVSLPWNLFIWGLSIQAISAWHSMRKISLSHIQHTD